MRCERCQKREATVHLQHVVGSTVHKVNLCVECANSCAANGENPIAGADLAALVSNLTLHAMNTAFNDVPDADAPIEDKVDGGAKTACKNCGATEVDIRESARMGCAECYNTHRELVQRILSHTHRGMQHCGKTPEGTDRHTSDGDSLDYGCLEQELARAVAEEAYERAAEIRDRLAECRSNETESD